MEMTNTIDGKSKKKLAPPKTNQTAVASDSLYRLAFNAAQATFISIALTGKIIAANKAACKMLGYTKTELLPRLWSSVILRDSQIRKIIKQPTNEHHFMALVSVIRKDGRRLHGEITAAFFRDEEGNNKMITTIKDLSRNIEQKKQVDTKKEKIVADNITLAKSLQKTIDTKNKKTVV